MLIKRRVEDLDKVEMHHFVEATKIDDNSGGIDNVIGNIMLDNLQLWVWRTDDSVCVFVTRVNEELDGSKEILVTMLHGVNATRYYEEITSSLNQWGYNLYGTTRMAAIIEDHLWERFSANGATADKTYVMVFKNYKGDDQ